MGQFSLFAVILVCLAIAFAISALWQRARGLAIALAIALPLAAGGLYWLKGSPAALNPDNTRPARSIEEAVAQLERLTAADPKNFGDMATLARAYMAQQDYAKASATYARALALRDDPDLSVEYAESLLRNSPDRRFPPVAVGMLERALQANPANQRALFFYGLHQRQSGQPARAAETWERLLALLDPSASVELRKQIAAARREAGLDPVAAASATIEAQVSLDPTLARNVQPGAVLYVFARKADGAGPPVAVKRLVPDRFPVTVQLGDEDSPMPTQKLSEQEQVLVTARLSQSGDARAASGDLEADAATVEIAKGGKVQLSLNRSVP